MNSTTAPVWCKVPEFKITKDSRLDILAYGGRLDVKWDPGTKVTPSGGLAYFAVFLKVTGFFDSLCSDFQNIVGQTREGLTPVNMSQ